MRVITTAGHIDHGKSSLVNALTGIDPDRLPEERARGMTIELGFAWLNLGDEQTVGVVDVPGHERFVRHMVAGVGSVDVALLVIAADEVVMPQTREHLAILDLLGIRHGVVALTKSDLVDSEWVSLAQDEVRMALEGTTLAGSQIVACSSVTGQGLDDLRRALRHALDQAPEPVHRGRPFLPIDRVFTREGHGTVVTGTLTGGSFSVGQDVEIAPTGRTAKIRGLHSYQQRLNTAGPGRRVAANLSGISVEEVQRGMVLCLPGTVRGARFLDLSIRAVRKDDLSRHAGAEHNDIIRHNMRVSVHTGSVEAQGKIRLLDADALKPGDIAWAQVTLDRPIAVSRGHRCILRAPSPAETVAGGTIVSINPRRHKRFSHAVIRRLERLSNATAEERCLDELARGPSTLAELEARLELPRSEVEQLVRSLARENVVQPLGNAPPARAADESPASASMVAAVDDDSVAEFWATSAWLEQALQATLSTLDDFHIRHPLRRGMPGEHLRDSAGIERRRWNVVLHRWRAAGNVSMEGDVVRAPTHAVALTADQERRANAWLAQLDANPHTPPTGAELSPLEVDILQMLQDQGDPVCLADGIYLRRSSFEAMRDGAMELIDREGTVTVGTLRDRFQTSRKFALAVLEHLDGMRLTRRVGDSRVRGRVAPGVDSTRH